MVHQAVDCTGNRLRGSSGCQQAVFIPTSILSDSTAIRNNCATTAGHRLQWWQAESLHSRWKYKYIQMPVKIPQLPVIGYLLNMDSLREGLPRLFGFEDLNLDSRANIRKPAQCIEEEVKPFEMPMVSDHPYPQRGSEFPGDWKKDRWINSWRDNFGFLIQSNFFCNEV